MSKSKKKAILKTARKNITLSLIDELTALASKLAPLSKGIKKEIRKNAKRLAKTISKASMMNSDALVDEHQKLLPASTEKPAVVNKTKAPVKKKAVEVDS